jgi:hypothetical protein
MAKRSPGSSTMQAMAEIEYEDNWGTIASEEERADDDRIPFSLEIEESFSLFNCRGTRGARSRQQAVA